jgi:hypothetical protein
MPDKILFTGSDSDLVLAKDASPPHDQNLAGNGLSTSKT